MQAREFEYTEQDFNHIRQLVGERTGIVLTESKKELVYSRISRRLRELGLMTFSDYRQILTSGHSSELEQFTNAITTNLTSFFRENHHFEFLKNDFIPELRKIKGTNRSLRIWSAGCSTGEEVYSICMTLRESMNDFSQWNIEILASDLDSDVLAAAKAGIYDIERVEAIDRSLLQRWFMKGQGSNAGKVRVSQELRDMVSFKQLNLMESWPIKNKFDVIFCRNVLIYFDKETQGRLVDRYAELLEDHGRLFVGHSENLLKVTDKYALLGKTIYKKAGA